MIGTMADSLNGSSPYSLDGVPGDSPVVAVRLRKADQARLAEIARLFGVPVSRVVRVAIGRGLVGIETTGLDDGDQRAGAA
jgi:hypothetical protein